MRVRHGLTDFVGTKTKQVNRGSEQRNSFQAQRRSSRGEHPSDLEVEVQIWSVSSTAGLIFQVVFHFAEIDGGTAVYQKLQRTAINSSLVLKIASVNLTFGVHFLVYRSARLLGHVLFYPCEKVMRIDKGYNYQEISSGLGNIWCGSCCCQRFW